MKFVCNIVRDPIDGGIIEVTHGKKREDILKNLRCGKYIEDNPVESGEWENRNVRSLFATVVSGIYSCNIFERWMGYKGSHL